MSTGVGSLPLSDFSNAVDYVMKNYSLVFLPEVRDPRSELPTMLSHLLNDQQLASYSAKDWKTFATSIRSSDSFFSAVYDISEWERRTCHQPRKIQIIGPRTLTHLFNSQFPEQHGAEIESTVFQFLVDKLVQLKKIIRQTKDSLYLCFDEPTLNDRNLESTNQILSPLLQVANLDPHFRVGIHCCAPIRLARFAQTFSYLGLSFDMSQASSSPEEVAAIHDIVTHEWVIFGVADTRARPLNTELVIEQAKKIREIWLPTDFTGPMILSGGCGTGTQTVLFEETISESLKAAVSFLQAPMLGK